MGASETCQKVVGLIDSETARGLVEELQQSGIATTTIDGADVAEGLFFRAVGRSILVGGLIALPPAVAVAFFAWDRNSAGIPAWMAMLFVVPTLVFVGAFFNAMVTVARRSHEVQDRTVLLVTRGGLSRSEWRHAASLIRAAGGKVMLRHPGGLARSDGSQRQSGHRLRVASPP